MKSQGIGTIADLRDRIAARIQQEKYVESKISPAQVTDAEARAWYEENRDSLAVPERVEVRHVFLATLDRPAEEAKAKLDAALASLRKSARISPRWRATSARTRRAGTTVALSAG